MAPTSPLANAAAMLALVATSLSCAATPPPQPGATAPTPRAVAELALGSGLGLGSSLGEVQARAPDLTLSPPSPHGEEVQSGVLIREILGVQSALTLRFYRGRLYELALRAAPASASSGGFARLSQRYEAALGVPEHTRCSPGPELSAPPSFLRSSWRSTAQRWTEVVLRSDPSGAALEASEYSGSLAPPPTDEPEGMMVDGRLEPSGPRPSCAERRAQAAAEQARPAPPSPPRDPGCQADLGDAPLASFLGLRFGASRAELEPLTGPLRSGWHASFERDLLGRPAAFTLHFYEGCLAVLTIDVPQADLARYEALSPLLGGALGDGEELRCSVTAGPAEPRRSASTRWRGRADLEGSLRLEPAADCPEEDHVVVELSYRPLGRYAPHIDF